MSEVNLEPPAGSSATVQVRLIQCTDAFIHSLNNSCVESVVVIKE